MVPVLINKDMFEPSHYDLKFTVQTCNYFCTNLIAMTFHETTNPETVEGDGRRANVVPEVREAEGSGKGSGGRHAPVHLASTEERFWEKLCRKDEEIQDGT